MKSTRIFDSTLDRSQILLSCSTKIIEVTHYMLIWARPQSQILSLMYHCGQSISDCSLSEVGHRLNSSRDLRTVLFGWNLDVEVVFAIPQGMSESPLPSGNVW
jgi:hypothetical protein